MSVPDYLAAQVVLDYHAVMTGKANPVMLKLSIRELEKYLAKQIESNSKSTEAVFTD